MHGTAVSSALCLHQLRQDKLFARCIGSDIDKAPCRFYDTETAGEIRRFVSGVRIGTSVMSKTTRTILILTTTLLFSLLATQALLFIHLLCEEHHAGHDSHECPVCQQLLSLPHSTTIEEQIVISQYPVCEQDLIFHIEVAPAISIPGLSDSRAPPVAS